MTRAPITLLMTLVLSLALALSGLAAPPAGPGLQVELCSTDGPVTVTLDARGQPVTPHTPCPECLVTPAAVLPPSPAVPVRMMTGRTDAAAPAPAVPLPVAHARPAARAPPVPV